MIDLINVSKKFGDITPLNNISIKINKGITAIIGPKGAGKTTLIRLILGLQKPTSGEIRVMGIDTRDSDINRDKLIDLIGYIPEKTAVYENLTAREYLNFFASLRGSNLEIDDLLSKYDLLERADNFLSTYSTGMKRRLELARVSLYEPKLVILDEPFNGLDSYTRSEVEKWINKQKNVIFSSHDISEAEGLADEVIVLKEGSVLFHDNVKVLRKKHPLF